jgi:hypothetical protein
MMAYLLVFLVFLVATAAIGYLTFKVGYALGWHDRGVEMAMPETALKRIDKELADQIENGSHSAIDPRARTMVLKTAIWH